MRLLYFAWVKEKTGIGAEDIELPATVATIADLMSWLKTRGPGTRARLRQRADVIGARCHRSDPCAP